MRAAPALQVTIDRRGPWRLAVIALVVIGTAPALVWLTRLSLSPLAALLVTLSGLCVACLLTWRWTRLPPVMLRYDGARWHLSHEADGQAYHPGHVMVMIDIGTSMLLRFDAELGSALRSKTWLPVRARDVGTQWHALRCAVYSPPPSVSPGPTAATTDL